MSNVLELRGLRHGSGIKKQIIAGQDVMSFCLLYCDSDKTWKYADASSEDTMPASLLTLSRVPKGQIGSALFIGEIKNMRWNWAPKKLLYASRTPGRLTQTKPNIKGNQVQAVGIAITETLILFNPSYTLEEVT